MKDGSSGQKVQRGAPSNTLIVEQSPAETREAAMTRMLLGPYVRHGISASTYAARMVAVSNAELGTMDYAEFVRDIAKRAEDGDLSMASRLLGAQAVTLDAMFTELARRAALNIGDHLNAVDRYGRLALKAQANCRATLEALAKLHQPREQTVRHVHVNEGGQAIVAEQIHHHGGGTGNAKSDERSHAPQPTRPACSSAALPRPDPIGNAVPSPGHERTAAMPNARRS